MNAVTKHEAQDVTDYAGGLLAVIERAARDPNTDIDKMERLFSLHERMLARNAEVEYSEALAAAKAEMPQIYRGKTNDSTRSSYADLASLAERADPIIAKHGFSLSYGTEPSHLDNHYRVTGRLRHRGGHHEDFKADVPADTVGMKGNQNKTPTHGFGSTMSYGRRYLKLMIFDIITTDDDGQAASTGAPVDLAELTELQRRCAQVGANETKLAHSLGVASLGFLPGARYREALAKLDAFEARKMAERAAK